MKCIVERILNGITDAVLICYSCERIERGHGRFCLDAAYLFGESVGGRRTPTTTQTSSKQDVKFSIRHIRILLK